MSIYRVIVPVMTTMVFEDIEADSIDDAIKKALEEPFAGEINSYTHETVWDDASVEEVL